jgi:peptidyl-prolyl cis-trans isomerase C/foldase protein PrsA
VGDTAIDERRVLSVLAQRGVARVGDPAARRLVTQRVLDEVVDEELLLQAAGKAGITATPEAVDREVRMRADGYPAGTFQRVLTAEQLTLDAFREGVRRRLTIDAFLRGHLATLPAVNDADVSARYEANLAQMKRPAEVRARQILVRTSEEARHILEQLQARRLTFEQAAQQYSTGLEADDGGDLGWFAQGEMPQAFDVCFALAPGQLSDVVASDYGFHLFQIVDKRAERTEQLPAVRERLVEELLRERQSAAVETLLAGLRKAIPVVVAPDGADHLVALLPPAPVTPSEVVEQGSGRALDSHDNASDPLPPLHPE